MKFKFFVPRSLMLRFIANNGALSNQETYWHNGIIYKSHLTQNMIKVEYDHENYTFNVYVQDRKKQIEDMQKIVTKIIKLIKHFIIRFAISNKCICSQLFFWQPRI